MRDTYGNTASGGGVSSLLHMAIHRQLASQHPKVRKGVVVTDGADATPGEIALARKLSLALQNSWSSLRRRSSQLRTNNTNHTANTHATPISGTPQHPHQPNGGVYKRTTPGSPHPTRRATSLGKRAHNADTTIASAAEAEQIASAAASLPSTRKTESRRVHFNEAPPVVVEYEACYESKEGQVAKPFKSVKRSTALHSEFITTAADEDPNLMHAFNMLDMYATMAKTVEA